MKIHEKLSLVQHELKAPKAQKNSFGNYNYRSLEDIFEAVKPLLFKHGLTLTMSDTPIQLGDRFYIESTARLVCNETGECIETKAVAREAQTKKGMDESQITGSTSSYSRKYNLNGLFAIDDTKDADTQDNRNPTTKIDQKAKKEFHTQMLEAIHEGSETKVKELWSEWDADEKVVLWGLFNSQERKTMKELMK